MSLDYSKLRNLDFDGIDHCDAPDYCDAYICSGDYEDETGTVRELTPSEIDELNDDACYVHEKLWNYLY